MGRRGELELIAWMRQRIGLDPRAVVGIGDDAAVVRVGERELLITVDMILERVHFRLDETTPYAVGRKAMNVNVSDIAAMAGRPTFAVVAVGLPASRPDDLADELFRGLCEAAAAFDVVIVGGDTNRSADGLVVSVTLLGEPTGRGPVLRSTARPGDGLFVTGPLGYSLDGKHLDFVPRVREAQQLHACCELHAMIDLSDGLSADLHHLIDESGCGALVDADAIPIRTPARVEIDDLRTPLDHALNDGEDFELLFTVSPAEGESLLRSQPLTSLGVTLHRIGTITAKGPSTLRVAGESRLLPRGGFAHD